MEGDWLLILPGRDGPLFYGYGRELTPIVDASLTWRRVAIEKSCGAVNLSRDSGVLREESVTRIDWDEDGTCWFTDLIVQFSSWGPSVHEQGVITATVDSAETGGEVFYALLLTFQGWPPERYPRRSISPEGSESRNHAAA